MQAVSLDHGVLNIPLAKRGNIDREIDRHKADAARTARAAAKAKAAETRQLRLQAKSAINELTDAYLARIGKPARMTAAQVRKSLLSDAHWRPAWVLRGLGKSAGGDQ